MEVVLLRLFGSHFQITREQRDAETETNFVNDSFHFALYHYLHQFAFNIMLNYPAMHSLSKRENSHKPARNCVYLSKIESSYHLEPDL